ncbi:permease-like cell division protein FtsX [Olsenella intestinalis]|uniref:permease-like cell division protein FtsX n=1 Tax=Olsenella intestinalis TaxID=2930083 RepID=UPI00201068C3|nr:permease-like cell division protein FtsX [Olsenella intestinalis]
MVPSNVGYSLREAGRHFRRNWSTVLGAIVTIFLSLFVIGLFVIGSVMVSRLVGNVEERVTIQAFIADDAKKESVDALQQKIRGWNAVESVDYKSKEQALNEYKETMSNRNAADAVAALDGENPVPASLVVNLSDPKSVESVANQLIGDADFGKICDDPSNPTASVQYGRETVERLFSVTYIIRIAALVLVALLAFIAFVFINNTIRLAIAARRREIAIMRLVGASNGFIRGPFVTEGLLEALIGSLLAVVVLHLGMVVAIPRLQNSLQFLSFELPVHVLVGTYAALVVIGMLIGLFGSMIAMRRYLKV